MPKTAIRTEGLSKRYRLGGLERYDTLRDAVTRLARRPVGERAERHVWALRGVDIEIAAGQAVGLIGPNGAGKTTLLRVLTRITEPTSGTAYVTGRVGSLLEVGTGFHPELTGRENVFLNGAILGMRRREVVAKLDEIVEFAGVDRFLDTPVKRYSTGMQVRLAFAVAAHLETEILLVDEVLAVGDAEFQRRCLGKMEGFAGTGRTVILVSHNMANITRLCARAILLRGGEIVEDGPATDVVARYLSGEYGTSARREWRDEDAPGGEHARLRSVRVVDGNGDDAPTVDVRRPVGIELVFEVATDDAPPFVPWIAVYNDQGVHVFSAMDTDRRWQEAVPRGRYLATAWVPANLLNEGTLIVSVSLNSLASGRAVRQAHVDHAVSFQVIDPALGDTARGNYAQPWPGPVRPMLRWTTQLESM
jgi:lipopolysaccharide transport system ATP-binding protein